MYLIREQQKEITGCCLAPGPSSLTWLSLANFWSPGIQTYCIRTPGGQTQGTVCAFFKKKKKQNSPDDANCAARLETTVINSAASWVRDPLPAPASNQIFPRLLYSQTGNISKRTWRSHIDFRLSRLWKQQLPLTIMIISWNTGHFNIKIAERT